MPNLGEAIPASQETVGLKAIAVTNTAIALSATSIQCRAVIIAANPANTAAIWVGNSATISTPVKSETGMPLQPNEKFTMDIDDVSKIFINGVGGDVATFIALQN